ncbi:hypothetical protein NQ315_011724 [Exocentrus adspersus]|uniref:Clarin-3 n=1 Tax=Exocentrus adspersus TaxID=1586481 RepID=A0AAV8W103_9CUCU|nr:hypothetical protein NQ315_011724 [Exocentrus adspersus]
MATVKRAFVFLTCIFSGLAAVFTLVALVTEQWVVTDDARWTNGEVTEPNTIKYGLFQGYFAQQYPVSTTLQITMTCLLSENVCALLCGRDQDERYTILRQLYQNNPNATQNNENCPALRGTFSYGRLPVSTYAADVNDDKKFINAGVWVSTIFFLALSIAVGLACAALSIWNTVANPVEAYFSIFGLYIYNAVALASVVIGMCLWGVMHLYVMFHNVGVFDTLAGNMTSDKTAHLGYSYWILIIPVVFYCASIALLYVRQYLLSKDPGHKMVHREDTADPAIYLY